MALIIQGSWSTAVPEGRAELVSKVTRLYGVQDDPEMQALALKMLDETTKEMNTFLYEFNKVVIEGLDLTEGTNTINLPAAFFKESQAMLTDSSGNDDAPLFYLPWVHFERTYNASNTSQEGVPFAYSARNYQEDGTITLYPTPSATAASNFTMKLEYYRRIGLPSEEDPLQVPAELEAALVFGAQKRMAIHIQGPGHTDVSALDSLEQRAHQRLIAIDNKHPDSNTRFRLIERSRRTFRHVRPTRTGVLFIG